MSFRKIQTTNLTSTETAFTDPLVVLNKDGTTPTDVGFLGRTGSTSYTGIVKDSQTNEFIVVDTITLTSQTTNDINALDASLTKGTVSLGTLKADTIVSPSIPTDVSDLTDTTGLLSSIDLSAVAQNIVPSADDTYDLGSATHRWRDLYLGPGSLYINNKKVISDESNTMEFKTDNDQSLTVKTSGTGVLTLQSDTTVNFAANLQMAAGKKITDVSGTAVTFGDKIDMDSNKIVNVSNPTTANDAANKAYVDQEIDNIVNGAPAILDTLNELANAIGDDANFATSVTTSINAKADTTYVDSQIAAVTITESQITDLGNYVTYYEQSAAPTAADAGSIWKDTDSNIIYMAAVDNNVLSWFEI